MASQKKRVKLNALQSKTLVLLQILARDPASALPVEGSEDVRISRLPHAHGNHVHVADYVVSSKDASGLTNKSVWTALARKGLVRDGWEENILITPEGLAYSTGLDSNFARVSDH